jgi:hypothetical protein
MKSYYAIKMSIRPIIDVKTHVLKPAAFREEENGYV